MAESTSLLRVASNAEFDSPRSIFFALSSGGIVRRFNGSIDDTGNLSIALLDFNRIKAALARGESSCTLIFVISSILAHENKRLLI